jgi:hypothetical protein
MQQTGGSSKVIPFSKRSSIDSIKGRPLKIRGAETCSARRTPSERQRPLLTVRCDENPIRESLLCRLRKLDAEQQQIVEIIAGATVRRAL